MKHPCKIRSHHISFGLIVLFLLFTISCTHFHKKTIGNTLSQSEKLLSPPQGLFDESWMEIYLLNKKVGYVHSITIRKEDVITTKSRTFMQVSRNGITLKTKVVEINNESINGKLISFRNETHLSGVPMLKTGIVSNDRITISNEQLGAKQVNEYTFHPNSLSNWGIYREIIKNGLQPNLSYNIKTYIPDLYEAKAITTKIEIQGRDVFTFRGKQNEGIKIKSSLQTSIGEINSFQWLNQNFEVVKSVMTIAKMPIEMYKVDEITALSSFTPTDIFKDTLIALNKSIPENAETVTFELISKNNKSTTTPPQTYSQKCAINDRGNTVITVTKNKHAELTNKPPVITKVAISEYLDSNIMINTEDPVIVKIAQMATIGHSGVLHKAYKLREFVTKHIRNKNLNIGFATASEVARNPEGDCSEHAVLLAALGRVCGIPSRVVSGLVYLPKFNNQENIMGYHMWTQFLIDEKWIDFDAALAESECTPKRIALLTTSLKNTSLSEIGLNLLEYVDQIEVKIIDIKSNN